MIVRGELEKAWGRVITGYDARDAILDDPGPFVASFDLQPEEVAWLTEMGPDLAALTRSFVAKRERGLRGGSALVLGLIGPLADELVEDYIEEAAPLELAVQDQLRFAALLVSELTTRQAEIDHGGVIVDVARLELMRMQARTTPRPLWPEAPSVDSFDPSCALRPDASLSVGSFGWDVRSVRGSRVALASLPDDPCTLLCFHSGEADGGRVLRLDDETADAVRLIAGRPGGVAPAEVVATMATSRSSVELLGRLVAAGALVWA
jgi:hypothetical protein